MKKSIGGLTLAFIAGTTLGWLLKPSRENLDRISTDVAFDLRSNESATLPSLAKDDSSEYSNEIAKLQSQIETLETLRSHLEMEHQRSMQIARRSHEELINKIDSIVFLEPHQMERLRNVFKLMEENQSVRSLRARGLITEKKANERLASLPPYPHYLRSLPEILSEDQLTLYKEAEYQEKRKRMRSSAIVSVERLTKNFDLDRNQVHHLIEQHLDVHADPSDYSKYIAPEFEELQVADTVKAEISLASKVLTESQLITYIENHLKRY